MPRTIKVKPLETIKRNYAQAAPEAARRYREAADRISWQSRALEGQDLYEQRMSDPEVLRRRANGISKVSDSEFRQAVKEKGAPVLATRMQQAADKQARGYAPIRAALEGLEIPDKTADPYQNIDNILKKVVRAMRQAAGKE
mgnify:CR=1 FL=1